MCIHIRAVMIYQSMCESQYFSHDVIRDTLHQNVDIILCLIDVNLFSNVLS